MTGPVVVHLTLSPPPHEATLWTARGMANATELAVSTIQKIRKAHGWRRIAGGCRCLFARHSEY